MTHYTNYAFEIQDNADSSAVVIGSLSQVDAPIETDVQSSETGGTYYPENVSIAGIKPSASFTSSDLPKVWNALGLIGRSIVEGTGKVGFGLYQAKYNDSAISAGSTHRLLSFAKSYAKINRISAGHQQDATIDVEAMSIWNKTVSPVQIDGAVALPTLPSNPGRWTLADGMQIGGQTLDCQINIEIDFGVSASSFGCNSDIFDTHLNLDSVQPKITITSLQPEKFADAIIPLIGRACTHANTSIKLRKRLEGQAGFVADGTAEHIEITAEGVLNVTNAHQGSANQRAQMALELTARFDGTNAPIIIDPAATIS